MNIKKKTKKVLFSIFILASVFVVIVLVRVFSDEDSWICENGKWVKHGNPTASMPTTQCVK